MVHIEHQEMPLNRQFDQADPNQRRFREIERTYKSQHRFCRFFLACPDMFHGKVHIRVYPLHRFPVRHFEARAQGFMALNQTAECFLEPVPVQRTFEYQRTRHVVAQLRSLKLIENIQTFLSGRKRIELPLFHSRNGNMLLPFHVGDCLCHIFNRRMTENVS